MGKSQIESTANKIVALLADGRISQAQWRLWIPRRITEHNQMIIANAKNVQDIPNILNTEFYKPLEFEATTQNKLDKLIFIAADLDQQVKGFSLLTEALGKIKDEGLFFHLDIVGKFHHKVALNFSHKYHGQISSEAVSALLGRTGICVVPSKMDNSPSVLVEAILRGNVVIGTNVGGIPEIIVDSQTGFLSEPNSQSLYYSIKRALNLTSVKQLEMKENMRNLVIHKFDSRKIIDRHIELYSQL
jgi:glycosyltransferase involved in cell wall biosynthesis